MSAKTSPEQLEEQIAAMQREIAALSELVRAIAEGNADTEDEGRIEKAKAMGKAAAAEIHEITDQVTEFVEKRPLQAAFLAFLLGTLIGSRGHR
jgi:TolA-binding protein